MFLFKIFLFLVDYKQQQDPYLLQTFKLEGITPSSRIALTPDGLCVAIALGNSVSVFSADSGELYTEMKKIFVGLIRELSFSRDGNLLGVCGDRFVTLFNNVPGVRAKIEDFEQRSIKATGAMSERLKTKIKECK